MTLKATSEDRFFAKELVDIYLKEMIDYLRILDMQDSEQKIAYYRDEMAKKDDIELKKNLATLVSLLIQKSVLAKSSEFYLVKPITIPDVANIKDKTNAKSFYSTLIDLYPDSNEAKTAKKNLAKL